MQHHLIMIGNMISDHGGSPEVLGPSLKARESMAFQQFHIHHFFQHLHPHCDPSERQIHHINLLSSEEFPAAAEAPLLYRPQHLQALSPRLLSLASSRQKNLPNRRVLVQIRFNYRVRDTKIGFVKFTLSCMNLIQNRAVALWRGSAGSRGFCGQVSSMYSRMIVDSQIGFPPWTRTGIILWTGLNRRSEGLLLARSSSTYS